MDGKNMRDCLRRTVSVESEQREPTGWNRLAYAGERRLFDRGPFDLVLKPSSE